MYLRILLLIALIAPLAGCYAYPRIEVADRIEFNYTPHSLKPMNADDMLCCYRCEA